MVQSHSGERGTETVSDRSSTDPNHDLRTRAAWIYYVEGKTQSEVAKALGINRIAVTRLLSDARRRGEVIVRLKSDLTDIVALQRQLETHFGFDQAIVAPYAAAPGGDPSPVIAAVAGQYISQLMTHGLTVGVGWGRTLYMTLPHIEGRRFKNVRIVSLLGGIVEAKRYNPAEFAWRFAELFDADGFLLTAPAMVDSVATRDALLGACGLDQILAMAEKSDVAIISAGGILDTSTSFHVGHMTETDRRSLLDAGCVGDVLFNFLDASGARVNHPANERAVAIQLDRLARIPKKVLVSGGSEKLPILKACIVSLTPSVLITDEQTAKGLLRD